MGECRRGIGKVGLAAKRAVTLAAALAAASAAALGTACQGPPGRGAPGSGDLVPAPGRAQIAASSRLPDRRAALLAGRVDFGDAAPGVGAAPGDAAGRRSQALANEVVNAATVSLIDLAAGSTLAGGKTGANGAFTLALGSTEVVQDKVYLLEAVRGLGSHKPGHDAPRFRTFVTWDGAAWRSISTPGVTINALTTAVAITSGLDPDVDPAAMLGRVDVGVARPTLIPQGSSLGSHPYDDVYQLEAEVVAALAGDADPVAAIMAFRPEIAEVSPAGGKPGSTVAIAGKGFSPSPAGNTVKFGSVRASVLAASPVRLVVAVPPEATSGDVTITTALGRSNGLPFSVEPAAAAGGGTQITSLQPAEGHPGTRIAIFGSGFSSTPGDHRVDFEGAAATPALASTTSLIVTVPDGARTGALTVTGPGGRSNLAWFRVPARIDEVFPTVSAPGQTVRIAGSGFGTASGSVTFGGAAGTVTSWSDTALEVRVPAGGSSGPIQIGTEGLTVTWSSFGLLAGRLTGSTTAALNAGRALMWAATARVGKYLYVFGGSNHVGGNLTDCDSAVRRIPIVGGDGALGGIEGAGVSLAGQTADAGIAVVGPYVYLVGGWDCGARSKKVQRATIGQGGSLTGFAFVPGTELDVAIGGAAVQVIGSYLYVFGGRAADSSTPKAIQRVAIKPDFTLDGNFESLQAPQLREGRAGAASQVIGNYVYLMGGGNDQGTHHKSIERAPIAADGTLGNFDYNPDALPYKCTYCSSVVFGNTLYVFWGYSQDGAGWPSRYVYKSTVLPNGSLSAFSSAGFTSSQQHRLMPPPLIVGNRVYILGGYTGANGDDWNGTWADVYETYRIE